MNKISKFAWVLIALFVLGISGSFMHASNAESPPQTALPSGPSFDCSKPNAIEAIICNDPELSSLDRKMSQLYSAARTDALGIGISNEQTAQRAWIKDRDSRCAKDDPMRGCLLIFYQNRVEELAVSTLFQEPDTALSELRHYNSDAAPVYEAILRYTTLEDTPERASTIEKLITPIFNKIHETPWANNPFRNMPTAHDVTASDKNFAMFLDLVSVSENNGYRLTLPCTALVRRPGLIAALSAIFGGAIDGQLINSDCETRLPALPKFTQLVHAAEKAQPFCQGTIRFSLGKEYKAALEAIRLHRADLWGGIMPGSSDDDGVDKFMDKQAPLIDAASTELFNYYTKEFKVEPELAQGQAEDAVNAAVSGAFGLCE